MPWSDGLTAGTPTHSIASSVNARIRVIAGPGTGKSFAMKRRVARLLEDGVEPDAISPVTFTRVAAEDLHRELVGMKVPRCDELNGVTLHSLGMRILMRNDVFAITGRTARPLNKFEVEPLVSDLMAAHGGKTAVRDGIDAYLAAWARLQHDNPGAPPTPQEAAFSVALIAWLVFHNAMLIGEIIPELHRYLVTNPLAPERTEFGHILVDEFQDLNKAEQEVVRLLSDNAHVCIVGDDDQSIYSFKHAHPEGINNWLVVNAGADDVGLVDCRRCPTRVVHMANSLIAHNVLRPVPRALVPMPANGQGDVRIIQYPNLDAEAAGVANAVVILINSGIPPGDILVLAQRDVIGNPIYDLLRLNNVPVRSYYAEAELDREEAQRRFSILKLFVDRTDKVALRWLVGLAGNNWNASGYSRVREHCAATGETPWQVLEKLSVETLQLPYTDNIVAVFEIIRQELEVLEQCNSLAEVIDVIFPDGNADTVDLRATAIRVLQEVGADAERRQFMSELNEAISQPEVPSEIHDVRIMSLHKSKGLSAPVTIVAGCVEGLLPKQPKAGTPAVQVAASLEELRRLFFVAITRVKAVPDQGKPGTLILTYSRQMPSKICKSGGIDPASSKWGVATLQGSRFLGELGPHAPAPVAG